MSRINQVSSVVRNFDRLTIKVFVLENLQYPFFCFYNIDCCCFLSQNFRYIQDLIYHIHQNCVHCVHIHIHIHIYLHPRHAHRGNSLKYSFHLNFSIVFILFVLFGYFSMYLCNRSELLDGFYSCGRWKELFGLSQTFVCCRSNSFVLGFGAVVSATVSATVPSLL